MQVESTIENTRKKSKPACEVENLIHNLSNISLDCQNVNGSISDIEPNESYSVILNEDIVSDDIIMNEDHIKLEKKMKICVMVLSFQIIIVKKS